MAYSHTTLSQLVSALAARLRDSEKVHWLDAELKLYINEALRLWAVSALYFRDRVTFDTVIGTKFYDISAAVNAAETPLQRSVTDRNVINLMQYQLSEAVNDFSASSVWAGTSMFVMSDLIGALQTAVNQFLFETGIVVAESQQVVTSGDGRVDLSQTFLDIVRAAWIQLDGNGAEYRISQLQRIDESTASKQSRRWNLNAGIPQAYSIVVVPNLQLQLIPPPSDTGSVHLLTVNSNTDLDVSMGVILNLPNDLTSVPRWAALAELFRRDGESQDSGRADYCAQRYTEGVELTKLYTTAMFGQINGVPAQINSAKDVDGHRFRWQSTSGTPKLIALTSSNLISFDCVPDGIYSVTLDAVRNAILPVNDSDSIQVGKEFIDVILDEAEHLALFKEGADALQRSAGLHTNFMKAARDYNAKLAANAQAFPVLASRAQEQYRDQPQKAA